MLKSFFAFVVKYRSSPSRFLPVTKNWLMCAALLFSVAAVSEVQATPSNAPHILKRRGLDDFSGSSEKPTLTLEQPKEGWMTSRMIEVKGYCSDESAKPIYVNINGARYYVRPVDGRFSRSFPAGRGKNNVVVECRNESGVASEKRTVDARIPPVALKVVLTSDTDGVYSDLHIYEAKGEHVYWASTLSPTGGLFFLNSNNGGSDEAGYGPYIYAHPAPPPGVYKIAANYWPGGASRHTLVTLDIIFDEGLPTEQRRKVRKPLTTGGETQVLAYVWVRGNKQSPEIFVVGQDSLDRLPKKNKEEANNSAKGFKESLDYLSPSDEQSLRRAVAMLALQQGRKISPAWDKGQQDCAGLIRFAYREALKPRTANQRANLFLPRKLHFPAVSGLARALLPAYPNVWLVGEAPPRFSHFADAETLLQRNFRQKGMDADSAEEGDVLAFRDSGRIDEPYHLMLVAKNRNGEKTLVYHNGAVGKEAGVRVVPLAAFETGQLPAWNPSDKNPNFLGVFEWNKIQSKNQNFARK